MADKTDIWVYATHFIGYQIESKSGKSLIYRIFYSVGTIFFVTYSDTQRM